MDSEHLVDCFNVNVGSTQLARVKSAQFTDDPMPIQSQASDIAGYHSIDQGAYDNTADLDTEDALAAPAIMALTGTQAVTATGLVANTENTYRKHTLLHGVLVGVNQTIEDLKPGSATFNYRNRAAPASTLLYDEHAVAAGSAPSVPTRRNTTRILATGSAFTPDGGAAIPIPGWIRNTWQAKAIVADGQPDGGSLFVDKLTVVGWLISGSLTFLDQSIVTSMSFGQSLCVAKRGTLALTARVTGRYDESSDPADAVLTYARIKFRKVVNNLANKGKGQCTVDYDAILRTALGAAMTIAQMMTLA